MLRKPAVFVLSLLLLSCLKNEAPVCSITTPGEGAVFLDTDSIPVSVEARDEDGFISEVNIYFEDEKVATLSEDPYNYVLSSPSDSTGDYSILVTAVDNNKSEATVRRRISIAGFPAVTTDTAYYIGTTTAIVGGQVTSGSSPFETGVFYGKEPQPEENGKLAMSSSTHNGFTVDLFDLDPGTTYYFKAVMNNDFATVLGEEQQFTTFSIGLPIITTRAVTNIGYTTASSGGIIVSDGLGYIFNKGICWSEDPNPTILDFITSEGEGSEPFSNEITGLDSGQTYYLRAYASNAAGIGYGEEITFTTMADESKLAGERALNEDITLTNQSTFTEETTLTNESISSAESSLKPATLSTNLKSHRR